MVTGNVRQWLEQSDVDYFTHFVKAWIPFNAWYRSQYDQASSERDILECVKADGNRMRSRIKHQLTASGADAEELRNYVAALHRRLSQDPLEDRRGRLSFEAVCIGPNGVTNATRSYRGSGYEVERRTSPREIVGTITNRSGVLLTRITQVGEWDVESFELLDAVRKLDPAKRGVLLDCYHRVRPWKYMNLLAEASEQDPIEMDSYSFVNDDQAIFAGLIDILYGMRNLLFHGELVPDAEANRTYEPAYHLLRHFLRAIA